MSKKPEVSQLARQILSGGGHVTLYTQQEFDEALAIGKAEIMTVAIETSKRAVYIERQACADVVNNLADAEDEGAVAAALRDAAEAKTANRHQLAVLNDPFEGLSSRRKKFVHATLLGFTTVIKQPITYYDTPCSYR
jgi:hypothetical protein